MRNGLIPLLCVGTCTVASGVPITTGTLIDEMVDMHRLTCFPAAPFKMVQFSSYDRSSSLPGEQGWFANADGFGGEPEPNFEAVIKAPEGDTPGEYLICDVDGPGAIVRTWTAQISGSIRVWLDNAEDPIYDGAAEDFLLHPYNTFLDVAGLRPDELAGTFYQRNASYAPIPFAKRCRMVWTGNHKDTHFYQVQIRKYAEGTEVATFSEDDLKDYAGRIRRTASLLSSPSKHWRYRSDREPVEIDARIAPKSMAAALELEGPGALECLILQVDAPDIDRALRQTILHIRCDGIPWGQVQSPVGDFFGAGPGVNPYESLPFTVAPDGAMTCRYVMPYKESVSVLLENRGDQEVSVTGSALPVAYTWNDDSSMHFRARWRINHGLVGTGDPDMGAQDLPFLVGRGTGVYVGTAIMLLNPNPVPTSWGNWWGEGDEKIFVDDDAQPSIFGTGSEDYFNYAWSTNDLFAFPYCGQPRNDGPANRGFVANFRWHVLDPIPFSKSFAFYMELLTHERTEGIAYARLGYHYARPGMMDDHVPLTDEDIRALGLPTTWEPAARFGASKFEFHDCESLLAGGSPVAYLEDGLWQGGKIAVWTPGKVGEELTLSLDIPEAGDYTLLLACMLRPDGGAFRAALGRANLSFNGNEAVKLVSAHQVQSRTFSARADKLTPGKQVLTLTALTADQPLGIDFVGLRKH